MKGNEAQRGDRIAPIHPKHHEETSVPCPPDHLPVCKCLGLGPRNQRELRNQGNQRAAPTELGEGPDPPRRVLSPRGELEQHRRVSQRKICTFHLPTANVGTE